MNIQSIVADTGMPKAILSLNLEGFSAESAYGKILIKGLLKVAAKKYAYDAIRSL